MTIDLAAIRVQGAIRSMRELRDSAQLVVHVEQSLVVVHWPLLLESAKVRTVVLGPQGEGKVVAKDVAVDNAWALFPGGERLLLARAGEVSVIDLAGVAALRKIAVAGLPEGTFGACVNGDGTRVLLVVARDVNFDFSEYAVVVADLKTGLLVTEHSITANADLEVTWGGAARAWLLEDTETGTRWQWNGETRAVKLEPRLAGPGMSARRHPTLPVWACLADGAEGQKIELRNDDGKVFESVAVPRATALRNLMWSGSDPNRLWGIGIRVLALIKIVP